MNKEHLPLPTPRRPFRSASLWGEGRGEGTNTMWECNSRSFDRRIDVRCTTTSQPLSRPSPQPLSPNRVHCVEDIDPGRGAFTIPVTASPGRCPGLLCQAPAGNDVLHRRPFVGTCCQKDWPHMMPLLVPARLSRQAAGRPAISASHCGRTSQPRKSSPMRNRHWIFLVGKLKLLNVETGACEGVEL
jgi:hypothetical protein